MKISAKPDLAKYQLHGEMLVNSYQQLTGKVFPIAAKSSEQLINDLWKAPFALVSHGTEQDPVFNFGNQTALELFEMDFTDFIQLPSRKSAEPVCQKERDRLLAQASEFGFIDHYSGVRISSTGTRFLIKNAVVWNLTKSDGEYYGQAAMFPDWELVSS